MPGLVLHGWMDNMERTDTTRRLPWYSVRTKAAVTFHRKLPRALDLTCLGRQRSEAGAPG